MSLRFTRLMWPALIGVALGAVAVEFLFGIECCPLRDWALQLAGMHHGS